MHTLSHSKATPVRLNPNQFLKETPNERKEAETEKERKLVGTDNNGLVGFARR